MPTYDFEDGLVPSAFKNADKQPWINSTVQSNGGTHSLSSANSLPDKNFSSFFIFADFDAGDFDVDYLISSESGFDYGYIIVDGVAIVNQVSGAGSWVSMPSHALSAGVHKIEFYYIKDNSGTSGDDAFYLDNLVLPAFTNIKGDVEYFSGGAIPVTGWTDDGTNPWVSSSGFSSSFDGLKSDIAAQSNTTTTLIYDSPVGAPAGEMFFGGFADSESNFDFFKLFIDNVEVYSDSGQLFNSQKRGILGHKQAVTSGTHEYKWTYSKDGSGNAESDSGFLSYFYEPSFTGGGGGVSIPVIMHSYRLRRA